jgi:hypothetical protein
VTGWWHARAGEIAEHRFLDSPQVTAAEIIETLGQRTAERCCGRRIIAVRNTTENKPPGPKTMRAGWDKLAAIATGCPLAVIP